MPGIQDMRVHAPLVVASGAVFIPLCSMMVALRFYARRIRGSTFGFDDWSILAGLAFVIGMGVALIVEVDRQKLAYPQNTSSAVAGGPNANLPFWILEILQVPALGFVKLSFLFFYQRVFVSRVSKRFFWISNIMIGIIVVWTISFFFSFVFICKGDFAAYWTSTVVEQEKCVKTNVLHNAYAISDLVTDVMIIVLPIPEIWQLHLPSSRKWAVMGVFLLGALTILMSAIRAGIFIAADSTLYDPDIDFEYLCTAALYWSMIESGLGLCAACLPVQWGLLRSEKVRSLLRSIHSLHSLGSGSRTSHSKTEQPSEKAVDSSELHSEPHSSDTHSVSKSGAPTWTQSPNDLRNIDENNNILVTRSFETAGQAV